MSELSQIVLILVTFISLLGLAFMCYQVASLRSKYADLDKNNVEVIKKNLILEYELGVSKRSKSKTKSKK